MGQGDPFYCPTFKKAILIHVAIDVDIFAGCQRELSLRVLIGTLKGVVAVGVAAKEEEHGS